MAAPIRIGDLLRDKGFIGDEHIRYALQVQRVTKEKLGQVLTRTGLVSEYDLVYTVSQQLKLDYVKLDSMTPDYQLLKRFNRNACLAQRVFPIAQQDNEILACISDIPDGKLEQMIVRATGMRPRFVMAEESRVISAIYNYFYFLDNPVEKLLQREVGIIAADTSRTVSPDTLINYILLLAVKQRATDVHLRPMARGIAVAFRVDGVMSNVAFLPPALSRVTTSIKLQAGMDIAEQRLPQDGRWTANLLERRYDIRVSSIVTPFGENVVMRLLSQEKASFSFPALGFLEEDVAILARIFDEPFGILLLTGPTGSGKSTTLVAGLTSLDLLGKNVLTVENPIEYVVPLARQTQVNEGAGYNFSNAMRHFLRHDPDVILIGEMRDEETASTALTAATTGHLVLSTLHANTAIGSIPRLQGLGMDTQLLSESLIGVVSQRLVRIICPHCKEEYAPSQDDLDYLGGAQITKLYRGKGCEACNQTGYIGRTLVYEILVVDRDVREAMERDIELTQLESMAKRKGFRTMYDVGVVKVQQGVTTVEELQRVLGKTRF
ncbi:GspE/PulE family protein [Desulfovibrio ferrophilus]|uniref:Type II secretion system protein E n=1 Tax=Desulfovibrio ferrophilus TaxID=241368 RepID=A0A2Z6AZL0_9BACT|nr:GspE/PulE family protein [Desulfovibrio ferrophilus]BBD08711.1 type II secretion system protein E [Desulfovibrio ferrophilus]